MTPTPGLVGASGLVFGSVKLFRATRMALENIRDGRRWFRGGRHWMSNDWCMHEAGFHIFNGCVAAPGLCLVELD